MSSWGAPAAAPAAPAAIKPSGFWYVVGGLLLVVGGMIVPAVVAGIAFFGVINALEDLDRVPAGSAGAFTLESGPQTIYVEGSGVDASTFLNVDAVVITGPDGEPEVLSRADGDDTPLALVDEVYLPQLYFLADEDGVYEIQPAEDASIPPEVESIVIGGSLEQLVEDRVASFLVAGLIAAVAGGAGLVVLIVTAVKRGRAKRQRSAGQGPPAAAGPPPGWGAPPSWGPPPPVGPSSGG